jgi:hypothetical protein
MRFGHMRNAVRLKMWFGQRGHMIDEIQVMNRLGSDSKNLQPDKLFVAYNQHKRKQ